MAVAKEIRTKIKSIQSTQKITRAMEMVAASKMRKAQDRMRATRPYSEKIRQVIDHVAHGHTEYQSIYMQDRKVENVGIIVISSDRGLCGGLNVNLFRKTLEQVQKLTSEQINPKFCLIGSKAESYLKRVKLPIMAHVSKIGDQPTVADIWGAVKVMLDAFSNNEIQSLYVCYNTFVTTMSQTPTVEQLLPIVPRPHAVDSSRNKPWDYLYEPDAKTLLDQLIMRYIESSVYQAIVENIACEQASRMVAMKSASDNAGQLINQLKMVYNKARQAAITQEISEIVGGAAAV